MAIRRDPITITAAAWQHIAAILATTPGQAFRIGVDTKGCAGLKYRYGLVALDEIDGSADRMDTDLGTVVLDRDGLLYLLGSTLDLRSDGINSQLVWSNPMATSTCGCGESFSTGGSGCST